MGFWGFGVSACKKESFQIKMIAAYSRKTKDRPLTWPDCIREWLALGAKGLPANAFPLRFRLRLVKKLIRIDNTFRRKFRQKTGIRGAERLQRGDPCNETHAPEAVNRW